MICCLYAGKEASTIVMSTTQVAATLFRLQELDLELDHLKSEHQTITTAMQGHTQLRRLRLDYETVHQQWQACLQTQKDAEWTLDELTLRLQQREQRLFSGSVVNARELESLQQETQRLRAQQNRQEEQILQMIDNADALSETVERKLADLRQAEEAWQAEHIALSARRDQVEARQQETQARRQKIASALADDLVVRYNTMRRTKQGRAISKVDQNSCQWCRVILTPSELQQVRISSTLQTCTNCGRILYYDR